MKLQKQFIKKKNKNKKKISTDVNFQFKNELIFYKNDRLCISFSCEKDIFEKTHDKNMHVDHYKIYKKFNKTMFIFKISKKFRQYIKYCSSCELNQIKQHVSYEELIFISTSTLFFKKIIMNFILILSRKYNIVLIIFDKIIKRKTFISKQNIITIKK